MRDGNVDRRVAAAVAARLAGLRQPVVDNNAERRWRHRRRSNTQTNAIDPTAKGPAQEVAGRQEGRHDHRHCADVRRTPSTRPTSTTSTRNEIGKLMFRTPDPVRRSGSGKPALVPDLTDLGTKSADKLTWTFKLKQGIKYEDGTDGQGRGPGVRDQAVVRPRPVRQRTDVPAEVLQGRRHVQGPVRPSGDELRRCRDPGRDTLVINLATTFSDLPFYLAFPMFTPIPKAKDTKKNYKNRPLATGPYKFDTYTPGTELKLSKNPNWDPATDPVRHQYLDGWDFKWRQDLIKAQQQVLDSAGRTPTRSTTPTSTLADPAAHRRQAGAARQGPGAVHHHVPDGRPEDPAGGPQGDRQGAPVRPWARPPA